MPAAVTVVLPPRVLAPTQTTPLVEVGPILLAEGEPVLQQLPRGSELPRQAGPEQPLLSLGNEGFEVSEGLLPQAPPSLATIARVGVPGRLAFRAGQTN